MNKCTVEILDVINKSSLVGNSATSFIKILEASEDIIINDNRLIFQETEFQFQASDYGVNSEALYIKIELDVIDEEKIHSFSKLIRTLRKIITESNIGKMQIIWDDISKYYCIQAYPKIYEIENMMRKLITKFMLINVGELWVKHTLPEDFSFGKGNDKTKKKADYDIMYQTDFIQLSDFLFDAYREMDVAELIRKLTPLEYDKMNAEQLRDIKKIIPKSNWEKYFTTHIQSDPLIIKENWKELYDLRCKVAHNRDFSKTDLDRVLSIIDLLKPIILNAITKTETIEVDRNDKSELATQFEDKLNNELTSEQKKFIHAIMSMYHSLRESYKKCIGKEEYDMSIQVSELVGTVVDSGAFGNITKNEIMDILINSADKEKVRLLTTLEMNDISTKANVIEFMANTFINQ
ncbi:Swt1 family HEPN domain-containing protein [Cronobacter turicensis]|uniref:Swt1 family HEPN domain-containing protein n=1 Tax=unclassified Cronobacter TaxID=2649764 RepID=UPI0013EC34F6|nr:MULTISPECIES: Swt1 family HEPN domain-containing protein [unclassified Cronobacter]KAF6593038.1 hypothetical protein G9G39_14970 [Cronobacter sp. EKM101R]KAF6600220.1 hypothetical protein G9G38_02805 [Cronobacter sp. EKM102R]